MRKWIVGVVGLVALSLALGGVYSYLFREIVRDNPALGIITEQFRWGKASIVLLDSNRDGIIDAKHLVAGDRDGVSPHDQTVEAWESTKCDGFFDLQMEFDPPGDLTQLAVDSDQDGVSDLMLSGDEAADFLSSLERPDCATLD